MPAPGAGSSELRLRILSSLVLGTAALASAWFGGWLLLAVWLGAGAALAHEWMTMTRVAPHRPAFAIAATGLAAAVLSFTFVTPIAAAVPIALALLLLAIVGRSGRDKGWAMLGFLYAAPVALVPIVLRWDQTAGMWPLLWMFAVVWTTDVTAYFVGRAVGGPKLWPKVSPNKTWSGFLGGLAGAVLAGTSLAAFADARAGYDMADIVTIVTLSGIASVASQAGDLAESAMKRHFGVKDSGRLIPGHGGFMDRLDGFAAVAILVCLLLPLAKFALWTVAP